MGGGGGMAGGGWGGGSGGKHFRDFAPLLTLKLRRACVLLVVCCWMRACLRCPVQGPESCVSGGSQGRNSLDTSSG